MSRQAEFDRVCLIGGGDLMVEAATMLLARGYAVCAIVAPRHAGEQLVFARGTLEQRLVQLSVRCVTTEDINRFDLASGEMSGPTTLALCFGPSWVFSPAVIERFGAGMLNVNPIPVPRYLGGAHYTWQILNGDRAGGCYIQQITTALDRGPIRFARRFDVPATARRPVDYFRAYFDESRRCIEDFLDAVRAGERLLSTPYSAVDAERLYFPRLMSAEQGYIDWSWSAAEIVRFCDAFDEPYPGAMTFFEGTRVHLKSVELADVRCDFHQFTAGLVVRVLSGQVVVAARGGGLRIDTVCDDAGISIESRLREGRRLVTPHERIEQALAFRPRLTGKGFAPS